MRTFRTVLEQRIWERRLTLEEFAEYAEQFAREHGEPGTIGVRHLQRLVAGQRRPGEPLGRVQPVTARLLERIFGVSVEELLSEPFVAEAAGEVVPAEPPARAEVDLAVVLDWLDDRVGWTAGISRSKVRSHLAKLGSDGALLDHRARRARIGRKRLTSVLADYYGTSAGTHGLYAARCGGSEITTSILTRRTWLDLGVPLTPEHDRLTLVDGEPHPRAALGDVGAMAAVARLAESAALGVRVANLPLYRLLSVDLGPTIDGTVGMVPFAEYALTVDLLEREVTEALGEGKWRSRLPLRDKYLPDLRAVLDLPGRVCAGGVLALCAIARPRDQFRDAPDFAVLVQERSGHVLNGTGRLAVIPKGFHQPLTDFRADARVGATLLRELEEELFGRSDVDTTAHSGRAASPMHLGRLSEPMRWLLEEPGRLRTECTGFGLNLVSGNYEFAGLIVIDDEDFWRRYGGQVEANWEAAGLQLYSSLDSELITELVSRESWSNEGLFALLQGLRRLRELGDDRVRLPLVEHSGL
ncbi:hypothetical protein GCM10010492_70060 [Saccharothrix mutabilis subsp. mutabilis]|uniref:Transcriptional regulator n=1 Tax=Saccharothrix mutabilis subsp. mutabilis TaxID=66855 RepID=A0ABP3EED1_9PSEU